MPNMAELAIKKAEQNAKLKQIDRLLDEIEPMSDADLIKQKLKEEQKQLIAQE